MSLFIANHLVRSCAEKASSMHASTECFWFTKKERGGGEGERRNDEEEKEEEGGGEGMS